MPYLDVAFECFGPHRLMIGSDWPVCTVAASYARAIGVVKDYLRRHPVQVQEKPSWEGMRNDSGEVERRSARWLANRAVHINGRNG